MKPQRVYEEMNARARGATPATSRRSAFRRSPARSSCMSTIRATGSTAARPARSAGPFRRRWACAPPIPTGTIVALSGDYDFQFMIEELAVGAQFKLPYLHMVVNNSYLGLIRQSQRGFQMDYCVQLGFDNINATPPATRPPATASITWRSPRAWAARRSASRARTRSRRRSRRRKALMKEFSVPVVIEIILERVTNIAMGTEIDNVIEFEEILAAIRTCRSARARTWAWWRARGRDDDEKCRAAPHPALRATSSRSAREGIRAPFSRGAGEGGLRVSEGRMRGGAILCESARTVGAE